MRFRSIFTTICIVCAIFTAGAHPSYDFHCSAVVTVTKINSDRSVGFTVATTSNCGTHLSAGEHRQIVPTAQPRDGLKKGKKYPVRYRYLATECMSGKNDCHRESFEFLPGNP